jgi:hypothetical protein
MLEKVVAGPTIWASRTNLVPEEKKTYELYKCFFLALQVLSTILIYQL